MKLKMRLSPEECTALRSQGHVNSSLSQRWGVRISLYDHPRWLQGKFPNLDVCQPKRFHAFILLFIWKQPGNSFRFAVDEERMPTAYIASSTTLWLIWLCIDACAGDEMSCKPGVQQGDSLRATHTTHQPFGPCSSCVSSHRRSK